MDWLLTTPPGQLDWDSAAVIEAPFAAVTKMIGQNLQDSWMGAESPPYKAKVEHGRSYSGGS